MKIIIKGKPKEKQSARFAKIGNYMKSYQPKELMNVIADMKMQIRQQLPKDFKPITGEIFIREVSFIYPPLKSFSKKKLNALEDDEDVYKTTKPDIDNLLKNLFDCCNGLVWVDDSRIVNIMNVNKVYGLVPQTKLVLEE